MNTVKETWQPGKKYSVVYVDIPWEDKEYQKKLRELPVQSWMAPEALLLLWIPASLLGTGLILLGHWGFDQAGMLAWRKLKDDLEEPSLYGECEFMLIGKAGEVKPSGLLRHNLYGAAASLGDYKPQGFRRIFGHAGRIAFGESANCLDLCGAYWRGKYTEYKQGDWEFLEG